MCNRLVCPSWCFEALLLEPLPAPGTCCLFPPEGLWFFLPISMKQKIELMKERSRKRHSSIFHNESVKFLIFFIHLKWCARTNGFGLSLPRKNVANTTPSMSSISNHNFIVKLKLQILIWILYFSTKKPFFKNIDVYSLFTISYSSSKRTNISPWKLTKLVSGKHRPFWLPARFPGEFHRLVQDNHFNSCQPEVGQNSIGYAVLITIAAGGVCGGGRQFEAPGLLFHCRESCCCVACVRGRVFDAPELPLHVWIGKKIILKKVYFILEYFKFNKWQSLNQKWENKK